MPPQKSTLFLSHGAPSIMSDDSPARRFFIGLPKSISRPSAIIVISAHWETEVVQISGSSQPKTIHDFSGFSQALYEANYPVPGSPEVAKKIQVALAQSGITSKINIEHGFDHGVWIPLSLMYPNADIPTVQISLCKTKDPEQHWQIGRALKHLMRDNVLIIGSGGLTHNLSEAAETMRGKLDIPTPNYATQFATWVDNTVCRDDMQSLKNWYTTAPGASRAHPTLDHFLPFLIARAAAGDNCQAKCIHRSFMYSCLSMNSYRFTSD